MLVRNMSLRNGVAEKEVKGRTRASSQRAANNSRTEPNTISPKAHKGIPTATKPSPKPQPPPKLNHSNSAKPHISDKPHPPQVTPVKSTKAPPKSHLIPRSSSSVRHAPSSHLHQMTLERLLLTSRRPSSRPRSKPQGSPYKLGT